MNDTLDTLLARLAALTDEAQQRWEAEQRRAHAELKAARALYDRFVELGLDRPALNPQLRAYEAAMKGVEL